MQSNIDPIHIEQHWSMYDCIRYARASAAKDMVLGLEAGNVAKSVQKSIPRLGDLTRFRRRIKR
jgi:hypothetical protein